jgi:hypothetical protein
MESTVPKPRFNLFPSASIRFEINPLTRLLRKRIWISIAPM